MEKETKEIASSSSSKFDDAKWDELGRGLDMQFQREIDARARPERDARIRYEMKSQIITETNVRNKQKRLELRSMVKTPADLLKWCKALTHDEICKIGSLRQVTSFDSFVDKYEDQLTKSWLIDRDNARNTDVLQRAYRQHVLVRYTTVDEWQQLGFTDDARVRLRRTHVTKELTKQPRLKKRVKKISSSSTLSTSVLSATAVAVKKERGPRSLLILYLKWHKVVDETTSKYYETPHNKFSEPGYYTHWSPSCGLAMFVGSLYQRTDTDQKRFVQQFYISNTRRVEVGTGQTFGHRIIQPMRLFTGPLRIIARFLMANDTDFHFRTRCCFIGTSNMYDLRYGRESFTYCTSWEKEPCDDKHGTIPRGRCCTEEQKPCGFDRRSVGTCKDKCNNVIDSKDDGKRCLRCPYSSCPKKNNTCHCPPRQHEEFGCKICSARDCPWQNANHYLNDKNPADGSWCPSCRIHTEDEKKERLAYLEEWRYKRLYRQVQWENRQHFLKQDVLEAVRKKFAAGVKTITTTVTTKRKRVEDDDEEAQKQAMKRGPTTKTTTKITNNTNITTKTTKTPPCITTSAKRMRK